MIVDFLIIVFLKITRLKPLHKEGDPSDPSPPPPLLLSFLYYQTFTFAD